MAKYAVLSDIHGNLQALQEVYNDIKLQEIQSVILLGDLIDYGMQSNEVVRFIRDEFEYPVICNIWGNHEHAIMLSDFSRFASSRGSQSAKRTAAILDKDVKIYIQTKLTHAGTLEFALDERKCLAVHGSLEDYYWKPILPDNVHGEYTEYDIVFSGHSHYPHFFMKFYENDDEKMRNKHAVIFINPGSVGQPRNHHAEAQYMIFNSDTQSADMRSIQYDVKKAMSFFDESVDIFYKNRLEIGI